MNGMVPRITFSFTQGIMSTSSAVSNPPKLQIFQRNGANICYRWGVLEPVWLFYHYESIQAWGQTHCDRLSYLDVFDLRLECICKYDGYYAGGGRTTVGLHLTDKC